MESSSSVDTARRQRYRLIALVAFATVLVSIGVLITRRADHIPWRKCATLMGYVESNDGPDSDTLCVYSQSGGIRRGYQGAGIRGKLLGYDQPSQSWVIFVDVTYPGPSIVLVHGSQRTEQRVHGLPRRAAIENAMLSNGEVFVPCHEGAALVLYRYSLHAKPLGTRRLQVPGKRGGMYGGAILSALATNGSVLASFAWVGPGGYDEDYPYALDNNKRTKFLFDAKGRAVCDLGDCWEAVFSSDCQSIALLDVDGDSIIIVDMETGMKRSISVWPPEGQTLIERQYIESLLTFRYDSRNKWLFCVYQGGSTRGGPVHAIDISSDRPVWHTLPVDVDDRTWVLLDRMPRRISD